MKLASVLGMLAVLTAPVAASADISTDQGGVSYVEAMECSAVFTYLASASDGPGAAAIEERAAKWLVIAMRRDGTADGRLADAELIPMVEDLVEVLEQAPDPADVEIFLDDLIGFCEAKEKVIAAEFDKIRV